MFHCLQFPPCWLKIYYITLTGLSGLSWMSPSIFYKKTYYQNKRYRQTHAKKFNKKEGEINYGHMLWSRLNNVQE